MALLCLLRGLVIACLLVAVGQAADKRIVYSLHCYTTNTSTEAPSVKSGQEFDLALIVQDLRPEVGDMARGVFAAYCNANYSTRYATLKYVSYTFPYVNGKNCFVTSSGLKSWGAFASLGSGSTDPIEVSRVRMRATWPPLVASSVNQVTASFWVTLNGIEHPKYDTLLYGTAKEGGHEYYPGEQSFVLPEEIEVIGTTLKITR